VKSLIGQLVGDVCEQCTTMFQRRFALLRVCRAGGRTAGRFQYRRRLKHLSDQHRPRAQRLIPYVQQLAARAGDACFQLRQFAQPIRGRLLLLIALPCQPPFGGNESLGPPRQVAHFLLSGRLALRLFGPPRVLRFAQSGPFGT
jgi:hypothetical protein